MLFVAGLLNSGCSISFQSNQLDRLVSLFSNEEDPYAHLIWNASWANRQFELYAISLPAETVFANDQGVQLHFDGWNITEAQGFLPNGQSARIESQADELLYFIDERLFDRHVCAEWRSSHSVDGSTRYLQDCEGREPYSNKINIDAAGEIVSLEFLLHPQYPALTMSPANISH